MVESLVIFPGPDYDRDKMAKSKKQPSGRRPRPGPKPTRRTGREPSGGGPLLAAGGTSDAAADELRLRTLVSAVADSEGELVSPEWVMVADLAERRGYVTRQRLRLYLTELGRQYLGESVERDTDAHATTMIRVTKRARLHLKELAKRAGAPMLEVASVILEAMHAKRDRVEQLDDLRDLVR